MQKFLAIALLAVALAPVSAFALGPVVYNVPPDPLPSLLLPGDILNYDPGANLYDNLTAPAGTTVNLFSGFVDFPNYVEGNLNLLGGSVSTPLFARDASVSLGLNSTLSDAALQRSQLDIVGGEVLVQLSATDSLVNMSEGAINVLGSIPGTTINMTGGRIGTAFLPVTGAGGVLNVSGGKLGFFRIADGVQLNMSGGTIEVFPWPSAFLAAPGSSVHLIVQSASIDGVAIPGLALGGTFELDVTNRIGELTGLLRDGSPFHFHLAKGRSNAALNGPMIVTAPTPTVGKISILLTQVPEPASALLAATISAPLVRRRFR